MEQKTVDIINKRIKQLELSALLYEMGGLLDRAEICKAKIRYLKEIVIIYKGFNRGIY